MSDSQPVDLIALAYGDPKQAVEAAAVAAKQAAAIGDDPGASHALRAKGLAHRGLNQVEDARRALAESISLAVGRPDLEAAARATLAGVHTLAGDTQAALEECDRALGLVDGPGRAYPLAQKGLACQRSGNTGAARDYYSQAIPLAQAGADLPTEANARTNRAILDAYSGRFDTARQDLARSREIYLLTNQRLAAAGAAHNLGFVLDRAGDYAEALTQYDLAIREFSDLGVPTGELLLDQCETLLAAGLARDGAELAAESERQLRSAGMAASHAEALLKMANAHLLAADFPTALTLASEASGKFQEQGRTVWAALADMIQLEASWVAGDLSVPLVGRARELARQLREAGFAAEADQALLRAGQIALALGDGDAAADAFTVLLADRRTAGLRNKAHRYMARAILATMAGRRDRAAEQIRLGLDVVDQLQMMVAALDLRAGLARYRVELAAMGLRQAIDADSPSMFLRWVERSRSRGLNTNPTGAADDPELSGALMRLRLAEADRAEMTRNETVDPEQDRRCRDLEGEVLRLLRRRPGPRGSSSRGPATVGGIRSRLAGRRLVVLAVVDDHVWSVTVDGRRAALGRCAPLESIRREVQLLRSALRRLNAGGTPESSAAAHRSLQASGRLLERWLLGDTGNETGNETGVLLHVPPELFDVPWQALTPDGDRTITLLPSIGRWLNSPTEAAPLQPVALVAGPRLEHAEPEIDALAAVHPNSTVIRPAEASVDALVAAFEACSTVHVAAHGVFRADNPMFSHLELADGPLSLADLGSLRSTPRTVVLAACDSGRHAAFPGDEAVGLALGLLELGVRTVVTSVLPFGDWAGKSVMTDLHRAMARGVHPSHGLIRPDRNEDPRALAARLSFVAVGD